MTRPGAGPPVVAPGWLTRVLRRHGALEDARVVSVEPEAIGTFTTELWRLRIRYDREEGPAPATLVLKRPAASRAEASNGSGLEGFAEEIHFYRELAAETPLATPECYFGRAAEPERPDPTLLLLEDVVGLQAVDWRRGADTRHGRLALEALARMHAHWWERTDDLASVTALADRDVLAGIARDFERAWPAVRERAAEVGAPAFVEIGDALVGRVAESLAPLGSRPTLLHGDAHFENLPLRRRPGLGPEVVALDWAGLLRGHASFDVAVFLVMSLPVEERRRSERTGVGIHADAVRAAGIDDWEDPWLDYRRGVLRRAARIVEIAPGWLARGRVSAAAFRMVAERCWTAAVDLDVGELVA